MNDFLPNYFSEDIGEAQFFTLDPELQAALLSPDLEIFTQAMIGIANDVHADTLSYINDRRSISGLDQS